MDVLEDAYPLQLEYGGLVFSSCAHAMEAAPYIKSCFALAQALAAEKLPERRALLVSRKKVETKRGATRWLRELNQKIEQFAAAEPDAEWDPQQTRRELLMLKFSQSHCKELLETKAASGCCGQSAEMLSVLDELGRLAVTPRSRVLLFVRVEQVADCETVEEERVPRLRIRAQERHWVVKAQSGAQAAKLIRRTLEGLPEGERPTEGTRLGVVRPTRAMLVELAEGLGAYALCICEK